jgi:hypothetical protein
MAINPPPIRIIKVGTNTLRFEPGPALAAWNHPPGCVILKLSAKAPTMGAWHATDQMAPGLEVMAWSEQRQYPAPTNQLPATITNAHRRQLKPSLSTRGMTMISPSKAPMKLPI